MHHDCYSSIDCPPGDAILGKEEIATDIEATRQRIENAIGQPLTNLYLRFPYGAGENDPDITAYVQELGYRDVFWNVDSLDSQEQSYYSRGDPQEMAAFVIYGSEDGEYPGITDFGYDPAVVMHSTKEWTAAALPYILLELQSLGYSMIALPR